jgi:hypothetical protein
MTHLYRYFGEDGTLLYIGVSLSAVQRLAQHRIHAPWFDQIKRIELETFATRQQAEAAERAAIIKEMPLFNISFSNSKARSRALNQHRKLRRFLKGRVCVTVNEWCETTGTNKLTAYRQMADGRLKFARLDERTRRIPTSEYQRLGLVAG